MVAAGAADREGFASVAPQSTMGHHLTHLGEAATGGEGCRIPVTTLDRLLADRPALAAAAHLREDRRRGPRARGHRGCPRPAAQRPGGGADLREGPQLQHGRRPATSRGLVRPLAGAGLLPVADAAREHGRAADAAGHDPRPLQRVRAGPGTSSRRPDYAKPFGTCPPPFRLPWKPSDDELVAETEAVIAARIGRSRPLGGAGRRLGGRLARRRRRRRAGDRRQRDRPRCRRHAAARAAGPRLPLSPRRPVPLRPRHGADGRGAGAARHVGPARRRGGPGADRIPACARAPAGGAGASSWSSSC